MATLGGTPKQVVDDVDSPVTFSPDAKRFAFMRNISKEGSSAIFVADANGANLQQLISTKQTEFNFFNSPAWSPDGTKIIVGAGKNQGGLAVEIFIVKIAVADGNLKPHGQKKWNNLNSFRWLKDGSGFLAVGRENETAASQVWRITFPGGEAEPVTNDFNDYSSLGLSADAAMLVTTRGDTNLGLWNYVPATKEIIQLLPETRNLFWDTRLAQTLNDKLIFSRREGSEVNIWTMDADGKDERRIVGEARATSPPVITPDGRFIVFTSKRSGGSRVWRVDADGKNPVQLTGDNSDTGDFNPKITPDGKTVIFNTSVFNQSSALMKVPVEGGSVEEVFKDPNKNCFMPFPSPNGKRLAFFSYDKTAIKRTIHIALLEDNKVKQIERILDSDFVSNFSWSPDGKSLTFLKGDNVSSLWKMPLDGGKNELLADLKTGRIFNFAWSLDDKSIYIVRGVVNNDLILIRDATEKP